MSNDTPSSAETRLRKAAVTTALTATALMSVACFQPSPKGRVVRIGGSARTATTRRGTGWRDGALPEVRQMTLHERLVAGEGWRLSGTLEHAAVAAFAQLSHRLMVLGAPSDLVERAHVAALDEIRHARRCFALASGYFGEPVSVGAFADLAGVPAMSDDRIAELCRLAVGSLRDGAVGEGTAALTATHAADGAVDPVVADTLRTIAREEAEHAELGWATVAWCLEAGGESVALALEEALDDLHRHIPPPQAPIPGITEARLVELGLLPQEALGRLAVGVVEASRAQTRAWIEASRRRAAS